MSHWAEPLIFLPWVSGREGPDSFDCWGLFRYTQREHYGIEVSAVGGNLQDVREAARLLERGAERDNWSEVRTPQDGDAITMARARVHTHIGVVVADGSSLGVLHCLEGVGVVFHPLSRLRSFGWNHCLYFRHKSKL